MKKRWIWVSVPLVAVVGIGLALGAPKTVVTVKTKPLLPQQVEQTVVCNGAVEAGESEGVFAPFTCVVSAVQVKEGQQVEAGQTLAVIDKEATRRLMGEDPAAQLVLAAMEEKLTAPTSGVVMAVKAVAGQPLEAGTPCIIIAPRSALQVRISIREKDLPKLKAGLIVHITGDGFRRDRYEGVLTEISSAAVNGGTGAMVKGVVTLQEDQADETLRLGLTAKAAVVTRTVQDGLVVPYEAVESDSDGMDYVYLLKNGVAVRHNLTVAAQLADGLLLADTALQGAVVILQPEKITDDGMSVDGEEL